MASFHDVRFALPCRVLALRSCRSIFSAEETSNVRLLALLSWLWWLSLATLIHDIAFVQLRDTPFARLDQWRQADMDYYANWSQHIASGDWLSRELPLPLHRWHHEVAERARQLDPNLETLTDDGLWRRWTRSPQFYQDPAYAYVLGACYVLRAGPVTLLACQLIVGIIGVGLVWREG